MIPVAKPQTRIYIRGGTLETEETITKCTVCEIVKPNSEYYMLKSLNTRRRQCKDCFNALQRQRHAEKKAKNAVLGKNSEAERMRVILDLKCLSEAGVDVNEWLHNPNYKPIIC